MKTIQIFCAHPIDARRSCANGNSHCAICKAEWLYADQLPATVVSYFHLDEVDDNKPK